MIHARDFLGTFWAFCNAVSQIFAVTRAALGSQIFCRLRVSLPSPDLVKCREGLNEFLDFLNKTQSQSATISLS